MSLIPGGMFLMGTEDGYIDERPVHRVELSPFYLDERVVTNREYQEFIVAKPQWQKDQVSSEVADQNYLNLWLDGRCPEELLDHSVINVSQRAAQEFAHWVGKRLPTEAEWEYAAGGLERLKWSIADSFEPQSYAFGQDGSRPCGSPPGQYPQNSFGLFDMCGLVWEWTQDSYETDFYQASEARDPVNRNPKAEWSVLRGGAAFFDDPFFLRIHIRGRNHPTACNEDYGFRCARDV
ncbi:MAG: SUMF1/EgtB/PvdO family nonheme iron enzyme [Chloracidobacterium sp.]|nr:SUMF1/EgtB/PvdO family nonheme iron enzyme [Chloracidobacterium sp.]